MAEVQKLSTRHIDILNYLIANPMVKLGDVAAHYGMTQPWLSQVIHSDAFQRMLKERQDDVFHHTVLPLKEKLTALAHQALDKLSDRVAAETDTKEVREVATSALDRIGFSPKSGPQAPAGNTLVLINVERERLAKARALIGRREPLLLENQPNALQANTESFLGRLTGQTALPAFTPEDSSAEEGG